MRTKFQIMHAIMALSAFASAATSPIVSSNDFVFTRCSYTNISGVVMGDGGDYRTMRLEDLAFIHEAVRERLAFTQDLYDFGEIYTNASSAWEFGRWSATETNGCISTIRAITAHGVTNTIARLYAVSNVLPRGVVMNVAGGSIRTRNLPTSGLAGLFASDRSYISRPTLVPIGSNSTDYICIDHKMDFVDISTNGLSGLFRSSVLTNAYAELRKCRWVPVSMYFHGADLYRAAARQDDYSSAYSAVRDDDGYYSWTGPTQSSSSSQYTNGAFRIYVSGTYSKTRKKFSYYRYDDPDGYPDKLSLDAVIDESKRFVSETPIEPPHVKAPFKANVDTFGYPSGRIASTDAFIECRVGASVETGSSVDSAVTNRIVLIPVTSAVSGSSADGYANFDLGTSWALVKSACESAIGIELPDSMSGMSCPAPSSVGGDITSAGATRTYELIIEPLRAIVVIELNPKTTLQGW